MAGNRGQADLSDDLLLERWRDGDDAAGVEIVHRLQPCVVQAVLDSVPSASMSEEQLGRRVKRAFKTFRERHIVNAQPLKADVKTALLSIVDSNEPEPYCYQSDGELLRDWQEDDLLAGRYLTERHYDDIYRTALRKLRSVREYQNGTPGMLTSQTFEVFIRRFIVDNKPVAHSVVRTLGSILGYKLKEHISRKRRERENADRMKHEEPVLQQVHAAANAETPCPSRLNALVRATRELTPKQRFGVLMLCFGFTREQMDWIYGATANGITAQAKKRLLRVLSALDEATLHGDERRDISTWRDKLLESLRGKPDLESKVARFKEALGGRNSNGSKKH